MKGLERHKCKTILALCVALSIGGVLWAQDPRGSIVGRVTDPTGAVVPGATVQIISKAMGTKLTVQTNEVGAYQALFLIPGQYQVVVEHPGFKRYVREGIELRVNDRLELNIALEVGTVDQSITVTAETPLLETATASLGTVVDSRRVADLPVAYGNPYLLMGLATGASFTRNPRLDRPFEPTHIVGYTIDGTRANRSDITLDGAPATSVAGAGEVTASYVPPVDAIQEFKVQTATFDASLGNTEGGVTNISIKSGTNELHGSAYYNTMLPEMTANDFFANATKQARADFKYRRWGGTFGGPVYIPRTYDGRNKTFFFFASEWIKDSRPRNDGTPTVPTRAMKEGDFSQLLALGSQYQIYNPFTRRAVAGGRYQADPFPGNIVPKGLHNPVALNILKYYPDPLQPGNPDGTQNYLQPNLQETTDYVNYTGRLDQVVREKHRLFLRVSWYDRDSFYNNYFHNLATGNFFQFISRNVVLDHVYSVTPSTVVNLRGGFNRFIRVTEGNPAAKGFDITTLGFPKAYADSIPPVARQFPRIEITGYQGTGIASEFRPTEVGSFSASVSRSQGTHFWKAGAEWRAYREQSVQYGNDQVGRFIFDATYTRGPLDNSPPAPGQLGQSVAALLLGLPSGSSYAARVDSYAEQSTGWGFYIHDDWKVTRRLTLNIGLRWEFELPMTERFNRSVRGFDFNYVQPFQAAVQAAYDPTLSPLLPPQIYTRGGLLFAGVDGQPRGLYNTPKKNLMPRFGFAYQVNNSTVVRGGYGIFYGFLGQRRGDVIMTGFSRNTPFIPTIDNINFINTLSNPFPNGVLMPLGNKMRQQTNVGNAVSFFDENPLVAYMQRWQFSIQREFKRFVFDLAYVGNRGTHVEYSHNLNATPAQYLSRSYFRDTATINALTRNVKNPFYGNLPEGASSAFTGTNIAVERLLRPYPHFDSLNHSNFDGYTWYHGLQFSVEKRFSQGYTLSGSYTFSKYMQATELLNASDPRPLEIISDFDRPHRITVSGIYELPLGRRGVLFKGAGAVVDRIVSGWQVSGIYTYQSGAPLGNWGNLIWIGDINQLKLPRSQQRVEMWFNPLKIDDPNNPGYGKVGFVSNSAQQLANNIRYFPFRFGFLRAHWINNFDLSAQKKTYIREGKEIIFRMDWLNAFNHPQFPQPNLSPTAVAFGTISASTQANYPRRIEFGFRFVF